MSRKKATSLADVFISYAQEDGAAAEQIAAAMTRQGWTVWWDRHIPVGRSYSQVIERELGMARCVVVLWSAASVASRWVEIEAAEALNRDVLVPVCIDDVRPPLEFRRLQAAIVRRAAGGALQDVGRCVEAVGRRLQETAGAPTNELDGGRAQGVATGLRIDSQGIAWIALLALAMILTLLWLGGFVFHVGGSLINLLLLIAVVMLIIGVARRLFRRRPT